MINADGVVEGDAAPPSTNSKLDMVVQLVAALKKTHGPGFRAILYVHDPNAAKEVGGLALCDIARSECGERGGSGFVVRYISERGERGMRAAEK